MKRPFVIVEWLDHCSSAGDETWKDADRVAALEPCTIASSGWVIRETKDFLVLASHIGLEENASLGGELCIIKGCITKRKNFSGQAR